VIEPRSLVAPLRRIHEEIRDAVVRACEEAAAGDLTRVAHEGEGDTIYAVDRVGEERLGALVERELGSFGPIVLVAEGLPGGRVVLPEGHAEGEAALRVLVDPIDGTRGLMYQKRSAWILTGVAPNRGPGTRLRDVVAAVQTEIPLVKQHLADTLSGAPTIAHGFAMIARFFPGAREELAAIDEEIVAAALGPVRRGKAHCFEDQYISTGGQLYELMAGHDRFVADLRPLLEGVLARRGLALGICCHPYDLATELIAREAGVVVTDPRGSPLEATLDVESDVAWVGYANEAIRSQVEPLLQAALRRRGLM